MYRWLLVALLIASSSYGGVLIEFPDAGRLTDSANVTYGSGSLDQISGDLFDNFDVDLFLIMIADPLNFSAATIDSPGFNVPDPQLFLFQYSGHAVYMNDDDESGLNGSQSLLAAGHPFGPIAAGLYYLGIGWFDNEPFSAVGRMFADGGTGTAGPDIGGNQPLSSWDDNVTGRIDRETFYQINLTGAEFAPVPEPATLPIAGLILVLVAKFLKRQSS